MNWLLHFLGVRPTVPNGAYNWWSGAGSDLGEVAIVGALVTIVRHHNCGTSGCFRFGRHEYEMNGVKHKLCKKHHPAVDHKHEFSAQEFADHHTKTKGRDANGRFKKETN